MRTSESTCEIASALSLAQSEISNSALSAVNPHFKSSYSKLDDVWSACRVALTKNNLAIVQFPEFEDGRVVVITRLEHKSGQWYESTLAMKPAQDTPQAIGSCITYARRFSLSAMVGVAPGENDDDGNEASSSKTMKPQFSKNNEAPKLPQDGNRLLSINNSEDKEMLLKTIESVNIIYKLEKAKLNKIWMDTLHAHPTLKELETVVRKNFESIKEMRNVS